MRDLNGEEHEVEAEGTACQLYVKVMPCAVDTRRFFRCYTVIQCLAGFTYRGPLHVSNFNSLALTVVPS